MAITAVASCLGPPPLPPGKRFLQKSSRKLSSTYKSFRDPAVEAWLLHGAPEDPMAKLRSRETTAERGTIANQSLFRSCSEGNLRAREKAAALSSNTPLDKCIKAIYGSWKNLLYRKCADIARDVTANRREYRLRNEICNFERGENSAVRAYRCSYFDI